MVRPVSVKEERRDSLRIRARMFVKGLGQERVWMDRLGDLSMGGVAFEHPHAPDAESFQVAISCPGEDRLIRAVGEVIDFEPRPGTRDREQPFKVRLKFTRIGEGDERSIARCLDRLTALC